MKVYFSGYQGGTLEREKRLIAAGITHRCFSFINVVRVPEIPMYYIGRTVPAYKYAMKHTGIMLDSGVYSIRRYIRRMQGQFRISRKTFLSQYTEYCLANRDKWDFHVTVDFRPDAAEIRKTHLELQRLGLRPVPAFHGDSTLDYLKMYRDEGFKLIAIGANRAYVKHKRRHLDSIFNFGAKYDIRFHGLALTSPWAMLGYKFESVDSSSWSRVAGVGGIIRYDPQTSRMDVIHVSDQFVGRDRRSVQQMSRDVLKRFRREIAAEGYDLDELKTDFTLRHIYNAQSMLKLAAAADRKHGTGTGAFRKLL